MCLLTYHQSFTKSPNWLIQNISRRLTKDFPQLPVRGEIWMSFFSSSSEQNFSFLLSYRVRYHVIYNNDISWVYGITQEFFVLCTTIWVRSRNCGCLVTWFCYQLIAKPGNKTAAVSWPDPYQFMLSSLPVTNKPTEVHGESSAGRQQRWVLQQHFGQHLEICLAVGVGELTSGQLHLEEGNRMKN